VPLLRRILRGKAALRPRTDNRRAHIDCIEREDRTGARFVILT
jgi:hypothetical protein